MYIHKWNPQERIAYYSSCVNPHCVAVSTSQAPEMMPLLPTQFPYVQTLKIVIGKMKSL